MVFATERQCNLERNYSLNFAGKEMKSNVCVFSLVVFGVISLHPGMCQTPALNLVVFGVIGLCPSMCQTPALNLVS